jgi:hypothetical protein
MLNYFALTILERYTGQSYLKMLSSASGLSERTWKNRVKDDWQPTQVEQERLAAKNSRIVIERMTTKLDYEASEASDILQRMPPGHYHCCQFLAACTMPHFHKYDRTRSFMESVDKLSNDLFEFKKADDIRSFKATLLGSPILSDEYWRSHHLVSDSAQWREMVQVATAWGDLERPLHTVIWNIAFSMFALWDLEFARFYFEDAYEPDPLFALVLPRVSRGVVFNPASNTFVRGNRPAKRGIFLPSTARLLELIAVLVHFRTFHKWPSGIPKVKEMAGLFGANEETIVSWRDETTLFDRFCLDRIWTDGITGDLRYGRPVSGIPTSLLAASVLFRDLLIRKNGKAVMLYDMRAEYIAWWTRHKNATSVSTKLGRRPNPIVEILS